MDVDSTTVVSKLYSYHLLFLYYNILVSISKTSQSTEHIHSITKIIVPFQYFKLFFFFCQLESVFFTSFSVYD